MLLHDLHVKQEFFIRQKQAGSEAHSTAQQSPTAEKLQGLCGVIQKKFQANEVEKHRERSGNSVIGFAVLPRDIFDRDLGNGRARPAGKGWNEAVRVTIELQVLDRVVPVGFEGCSKIVQIYARQLGQ